MKTLIVTSFALVVAATGFARAEESRDCGNTPKDKWLSEDVIKDKAKAAGMDVRSVKVEGSCYEVYAKDKDGNRVEMVFNPGTGEPLGNEAEE